MYQSGQSGFDMKLVSFNFSNFNWNKICCYDSRPDPTNDQTPGGGEQTEVDASATGNDQRQNRKWKREQLLRNLGLRLQTTREHWIYQRSSKLANIAPSYKSLDCTPQTLKLFISQSSVRIHVTDVYQTSI